MSAAPGGARLPQSYAAVRGSCSPSCQHILHQLPLAQDVASRLSCRALCDAAKLAFKVRPFSARS